jgi:salicylate hydroxylase
MGSKRLDYAIIGGGISGLCLAIALHHRGVSVHIYERARKFGEIGAGVSFTSNALQSMKICHPGIHDAFEKVSTRNVWPSKQSVWFDYYNGQQASSEKPAFSITNDLGQRGVHRAHFLDELVKMIPSDISSFGKELERYERGSDGVYTLSFGDGSTARADAIIACDGIKSRVRQLMFGIDHECAFPSYTHKYAYRALVPMADAAAAIGSEKAENACMHVSQSSYEPPTAAEHLLSTTRWVKGAMS